LQLCLSAEPPILGDKNNKSGKGLSVLGQHSNNSLLMGIFNHTFIPLFAVMKIEAQTTTNHVAHRMLKERSVSSSTYRAPEP
jgi:hypothetical protein